MGWLSKCRRTTTMSDLPNDLLEDILYRLPTKSLRSMRSTCKKWNSLSKNQDFAKALAARQQFLGFMLMNSRVCYLRFNLQVTCNDGDFVDLSIHQVSTPDDINISQVIYCDGLLLCVVEDNSRLLVWNPYLGQIRWIRSFNKFKSELDTYAIGYDNKNRNFKVLRFLEDLTNNSGQRFELYDFNSNSWKVLDDLDDDTSPNWDIWAPQLGSVSLKGNTYFFVQENREDEEVEANAEIEHFLLCFDFTKEEFGSRLFLPFNCNDEEIINLSCVREEQLAALYNRLSTTKALEIWVTDKTEPEAVSWIKFLKVDITPLDSFPAKFFAESFFIDEEKKVAVIFGENGSYTTGCYNTANIVGEDGSIKSVNVFFEENVKLNSNQKKRLLQ